MAVGPIPAYKQTIERDLSAGIATEHTHRPTIKALIEALDSGVVASNDPKRVECGAPDFSVAHSSQHGPRTLGHIETKDVDVSLHKIEKDSERANPATENGKQLKRYRAALPNLILTDYLEFRWYVDGQRRGSPVRLAKTKIGGQLTLEKDGSTSVEKLLRDFLGQRPPPIGQPKELAERMARLTHLIRDVIVEALEKGVGSGTLRDLRKAFAEVLIPDLSNHGFADMFAQTLAYGLFAARYNHSGSGPFRRRDAAAEIPRTNPFLRRLFSAFAGSELDDEPYAGLVDDLAQLLSETDMHAVLASFGKRTRREDPVVHFYESYLAAYDPKLRKSRGVYFTPEPVVSYIVRSVDFLLSRSFGCELGLADTSQITFEEADGQSQASSPRILVLDPACGTGTFLYGVIDHIREHFMDADNAGKWSVFVREQLLPRLYGFELLMAPYAVAHLKLGMELAALDLPTSQRANWAYDFASAERIGVYLTNSLEQAAQKSELLMGGYISEEANAASRIKRDMPIMVVLGNPPYSRHSANNGTWIKGLVEDYKRGVPGLDKPAQGKALQDDYVKFLRFGQWRIQRSSGGVLAFITNHGYIDNPTFRGMRKQLIDAFSDIYILDLHGNSNKKEVSPDGRPDENVFDIRAGVSIGIFVKEPNSSGPARIHHHDVWGTREDKYEYLMSNTLETTGWVQVGAESPLYLFVPEQEDIREEYQRGWSLPEVMREHKDQRPAPGIVTTQDEFAISFSAEEAEAKVDRFLTTKTEDEARSIWRLCSTDQWNYSRAKKALSAGQWRPEVRPILYRPFDERWTVLDSNVAVHLRTRVMRHMRNSNNIALLSARTNKSPNADHFFCSRLITETKAGESTTQSYLLPLYLLPGVEEVASGLYREDERRPNLAQEFLSAATSKLGLRFVPDGVGDLKNSLGPEDIFHYIYAIFHSREYRTRYAQFLKTDFPRIPLTSDLDLFRRLVQSGSELVAVHLLEAPSVAQSITRYPVPGDNVVEAGCPSYMAPGSVDTYSGDQLKQGRVYLSKDDSRSGKRGQYFEGVSPDVWSFHVGGYQPCEKWLKDRSGRSLSMGDIEHYERIIKALSETIVLMDQIGAIIPGWPID